MVEFRVELGTPLFGRKDSKPKEETVYPIVVRYRNLILLLNLSATPILEPYPGQKKDSLRR